MRKLLAISLTLGLVGTVLLSQAPGLMAGVAASESAKLDATGFAVIELFTSEGCSSCPPADLVLSELSAEYAGAAVFPLSFHVDYWNDLGWRDAYSDAAFSTRQRRYAGELGQGRVYTPQVVINGRVETIGSHASTIRALLARALATPARPGPAISLHVTKSQTGALDVQHTLVRAPAGAKLSLLLVQRSAESKVTRGENASRTLLHSNVVRAIVSAAANGTTTLSSPAGLSPKDSFVVALLEAPGSHAIVAAARASLTGQAN